MVIGNSTYEVKGIRKREFELSNKSAIEAHLKGNFAYPWKRAVVEFYVTVRMEGEDWDRTLVFDESEFKKLFPLYSD